ncbi:hypothetical protein JTB14_037253 [Gonioctena quinquepunctata]|nr:hypothetical protein JTB14_037253 [Gonioctena quinquepunctata]
MAYTQINNYCSTDHGNNEKTSGAANNDGRLFDRSDDLMTKIENNGNVLNELVEDVSVLKKTQISVQRILHDCQTIGVTYDPIHAVSEYDNCIPKDCREVQDRGEDGLNPIFTFAAIYPNNVSFHELFHNVDNAKKMILRQNNFMEHTMNPK